MKKIPLADIGLWCGAGLVAFFWSLNGLGRVTTHHEPPASGLLTLIGSS
jgi:hypothetical protein